ncbi:MAG: hypothetical protein C0601_09625 [Candidatus Muiribacterium halophilum]|uniref:FAD-binding PCMH-type domain-containing protein n=1 Tax=Muiribacterium halophilum TaxID=2053465 RepID=A0A2N5ZDH5_MUIH1|nr:MAG: hypothetical protein C0601_09625 [Candidatus Muirbacterium halophilum]
MLNENLIFKKANDMSDIFTYLKEGHLPFSGGTDVLIKLKEGFLKNNKVVYIGDVPQLRGISIVNDKVVIGSAEKITNIIEFFEEKNIFPALKNALLTIGSVQIRNQATLGGNLGNCSPVADSIPMLMCLDAVVNLVSSENKRKLPLVDFPKGVCQNALLTGEIIHSIEIPLSESKNIQFYRKFGQRKEVAIQKCSVGAYIEIEKDIVKDARIAIGAVYTRALRVDDAESYLNGKSLSEDVIKEAATLISAASKPITDIRSDEEYRKVMVGNGFYEEMLKAVKSEK